MVRPILIAITAGAVAFILLFVFFGGLFSGPSGPDTTTHSREVAGFYGTGSFAGELLQSDVIQTNTTDGLSQSVVFQGKIYNRVPNLGRVFLDGAKVTDPDAYYRVTVNGLEVFRHNMEVGESSAFSGYVEFVEREYVISGAATGLVRAELVVYVFSFERGAGGYEVLAYDTAVLR